MRIILGLLLILPASALAQVTVTVGLPTIHFQAPPPLVVVQSGVQVVEDYDDDLYVVGGRYWVRRGDRWYRARDHRGGWVYVPNRSVPSKLVRMKPGHYRRWKRDHGHGHHDVRRASAHRDDHRRDHRGDYRGKHKGKYKNHKKHDGHGHDRSRSKLKTRSRGRD